MENTKDTSKKEEMEARIRALMERVNHIRGYLEADPYNKNIRADIEKLEKEISELWSAWRAE